MDVLRVMAVDAVAETSGLCGVATCVVWRLVLAESWRSVASSSISVSALFTRQHTRTHGHTQRCDLDESFVGC